MRTSLAILLLTSTLLGGCEQTDFQEISSSSSQARPQAGVTLTGSLVDENQTPLARSVRVVAHERTTGQKFEATSSADGTFELAVAPGVYDVGIDDPDDNSTSTGYYGPVALGADLSRDFVLPASAGHTSDEIFGRIFSNGAPTPGLRIVAEPRSVLLDGAPVAGQEIPFPDTLPSVETVITQDGDFSIVLPSPGDVSLNLELYTSKAVGKGCRKL